MVDPIIGGLVGVFLLLIFLFMGVPIFVSMGLSGAIGILLIEGFSGISLAIANSVWKQMTSIGLLAVPAFVFMGNFVSEHDAGKDLYETATKWLGRVPGSLAIVSTIVGAMFGFMCGSGVAGTATIGGVSLPEMEKRRYNRRLSLGTLALAGALSAIIPPSILMIIYAVQAEVSMGKMFFAGIIPGWVLAGLMIVYILCRVAINPMLCPKPEKIEREGKLKSLVNLAPVLILFLVVLGGIYAGIWSPQEAGAGGVFFAFIIALGQRRFEWKKLMKVISMTSKTTIMIYMLVIGASIFSLLCSVSGMSDMLEKLILSFNLPRWGIIIIILISLTILGGPLDTMTLLLVTLPISLPIIMGLGYDPIWWGIIMIITCELAEISPPIGIHLFIIKSIAPQGTTLTDVYWGAVPYCLIIWVLFLLLIAFPGIVMWLPNTMMR